MLLLLLWYLKRASTSPPGQAAQQQCHKQRDLEEIQQCVTNKAFQLLHEKFSTLVQQHTWQGARGGRETRNKEPTSTLDLAPSNKPMFISTKVSISAGLQSRNVA